MKSGSGHRKTEHRRRIRTCKELRISPLQDLFLYWTRRHTWQSREHPQLRSPRTKTRPTLALSALPQYSAATRGSASNRNNMGHRLRQPTASPGFRHRGRVRLRSRLARYFAGAGCGVACGGALGVEKFTFGTWRDSSVAAKYAL